MPEDRWTMSDSNKIRPNIVRERGLVTIIALMFAVSMFVGLSSWLLPTAWSNLLGAHLPVRTDVSAALLLNVALILLIWRRSTQLTVQTRVAGHAKRIAEQISTHDYSTGLFNRPAMVNKIEEMLAEREKLSLIVFDLDNFKKVNDLYGHDAGDDLLLQIADRLKNVVPDESMCARLGGDEFAVLIHGDDATPENALSLAERIAETFQTEFMVAGGHAKVGASVGIYSSIEPGSTSADLFRRGDIAMYRAKRQGGRNVAMFEPKMEAEVHQRYKMETDIREGIPKGEFVPYYQPQYGIRGDKLLGFEVLARWNHPVRQLVEPADFIPIAESTGLIAPLSMSVMRQALTDASSWDHSLILAVNISPVQLNDPILDQQIMKLLIETGFPPQRLELEITESALMEDTAMVLNTITSLKSLGIKISLDDFGTGYSSMTQLKNFPFDRIKIDRSFVLSMLENEESAAIVNSIASLASSLDVPITAEGIESDEIRTCLDEIGCTDGQGWLYGRPASKEDLLKLLPEIRLSAKDDQVEVVDGGRDETAGEPDSSAENDKRRSA